MRGVIGTLGELIEVPAELERAIEAALGGRVQDIVVQRWQDAEAAVAFLKRSQAGRATFLPLDTLRPGRPSDVPRAAGVLGLASELVRFDAAIRPAVELALNHTLVVEDLPTARRLLGRAGRRHAGHAGRRDRAAQRQRHRRQREQGHDSGMLSRARTLRELPPQIEAGTDAGRRATRRGWPAARREQTAHAPPSMRCGRSGRGSLPS